MNVNASDSDSPLKLQDHPAAIERIQELFTIHWPNLYRSELLEEIIRFFGGYPSDEVEEALSRHIENTTTDSRGIPVGRYPPTVADLRKQVEQISIRRQQERLQAEQERRRQESDVFYTHALQTPSWRREIAQGQAIRIALEQKFSLNFRLPADARLLMGVLRDVESETGLGTVEEALRCAQKRLEKRKETQDVYPFP